MSLPFSMESVETFQKYVRGLNLVNEFLSARTLNLLADSGKVKSVYGNTSYNGGCAIEFTCPDHEALPIVQSLLLNWNPIFKPLDGMVFVRESLWDFRATLRMRVDLFVRCAIEPELPLIEFKCPKPMTVSPACFKLVHWKHRGIRKARLDFNHPTLHDHNKHGADAEFEIETTRQQMWDSLISKVEQQVLEHQCYITTEPLVVAVHKAQIKMKSVVA